MKTQLEIKMMLITDDRWLYRGILAIYEYQTSSEKQVRDTIDDNGVGFNSSDAKTLSRFAEQLKNGGTLSVTDKAKAKERMVKYAGQLHKLAVQKEVVNV